MRCHSFGVQSTRAAIYVGGVSSIKHRREGILWVPTRDEELRWLDNIADLDFLIILFIVSNRYRITQREFDIVMHH